MPHIVTLAEIQAAADRISGVAVRTGLYLIDPARLRAAGGIDQVQPRPHRHSGDAVGGSLDFGECDEVRHGRTPIVRRGSGFGKAARVAVVS